MTQKEILNHTWLRGQAQLVRTGSTFMFDSINGLLLTNVSREKMVVRQNKEKVLSFIAEKKRAYLSEICEKFNLNIVEVKMILNELEKERKIIINE